MENITLRVKRKWGYVGAAMPYRIKFEGYEVGSIATGQETVVTIPCRPGTLSFEMLGNGLMIHKLSASFFVDPKKCPLRRIDCVINTKSKLSGMITGGLFSPMAKVELETKFS